MATTFQRPVHRNDTSAHVPNSCSFAPSRSAASSSSPPHTAPVMEKANSTYSLGCNSSRSAYRRWAAFGCPWSQSEPPLGRRPEPVRVNSCLMASTMSTWNPSKPLLVSLVSIDWCDHTIATGCHPSLSTFYGELSHGDCSTKLTKHWTIGLFQSLRARASANARTDRRSSRELAPSLRSVCSQPSTHIPISELSGSGSLRMMTSPPSQSTTRVCQGSCKFSFGPRKLRKGQVRIRDAIPFEGYLGCV